MRLKMKIIYLFDLFESVYSMCTKKMLKSQNRAEMFAMSSNQVSVYISPAFHYLKHVMPYFSESYNLYMILTYWCYELTIVFKGYWLLNFCQKLLTCLWDKIKEPYMVMGFYWKMCKMQWLSKFCHVLLPRWFWLLCD